MMLYSAWYFRGVYLDGEVRKSGSFCTLHSGGHGDSCGAVFVKVAFLDSMQSHGVERSPVSVAAVMLLSLSPLMPACT